MSKCNCYHERSERRYIFNTFTGIPETSYLSTYGVCYGTKECDVCGGDMTKCDYYMPSAIKQLSALAISRDVIDQLYWDDLINEDDNDALRTIWLCAEREIRSAKCLE